MANTSDVVEDKNEVDEIMGRMEELLVCLSCIIDLPECDKLSTMDGITVRKLRRDLSIMLTHDLDSLWALYD